jgi:hypothetical protein
MFKIMIHANLQPLQHPSGFGSYYRITSVHRLLFLFLEATLTYQLGAQEYAAIHMLRVFLWADGNNLPYRGACTHSVTMETLE